MSERKLLFIGVIASPTSLSLLSITHGFIAVEDGKITQKGTVEEYAEQFFAFLGFKVVRLSESQLLLPGFVDCHTHAPQFPNIGLGLDHPLLEWLDKYTFPLERQYKDVDFAATVYDKVVQRLLVNGTTTACYFGSLHLEGTLELVKKVIEHGQRALVGKVSMNIENSAGYYNDTNKEIQDVEAFITNVLAYKNELVAPIITPRFAVSCDEELMSGLSKLAQKYGCRIQSHISENVEEVEHVLKSNPQCNSYGHVYDKSNILNERCIMAHAVHLTAEELTLLSTRGVAVAHCPASNTRLRSGLCPVRKLINSNIKVGLGTDVGAGDSATILDAMRRTMDVSTHLQLLGGQDAPIDWKEAVCLATLGGARALNLDDKIGSFEVGKDLDALLVDVHATAGPVDDYQYCGQVTDEQRAVSLLQRFVYLGDDRNILQVYVKGKLVKNIK